MQMISPQNRPVKAQFRESTQRLSVFRSQCQLVSVLLVDGYRYVLSAWGIFCTVIYMYFSKTLRLPNNLGITVSSGCATKGPGKTFNVSPVSERAYRTGKITWCRSDHDQETGIPRDDAMDCGCDCGCGCDSGCERAPQQVAALCVLECCRRRRFASARLALGAVCPRQAPAVCTPTRAGT